MQGLPQSFTKVRSLYNGGIYRYFIDFLHFHILETLREQENMSLEMKRKKKHDKYAVAGWAKLPGILAL